MAFPPKHVVVASDLSESSRTALDTAGFFAREHGAKLELLHVFDPSPYVPLALPASGSQLMSQAAKEMRETAEKGLQEQAEAAFPGLEVSVTCLRREDAGEGISEHAKAVGADLIIVGSHGRTGLKRVLLGSVAERVVRLSTCPVLVVRPE
ncbi:MAG: universal stress protein [Sandaracinus sp.]|nr:universal stress protein [Sandaracinus sp.]